MSIIFLDIDGVLVTENKFKREMEKNGRPQSGKRAPFDEFAVANLNALIEEFDGKIVVSSTWRFGESVVSLQEILRSNGVRGNVIGLTPDLSEKKNGLWRSVERGEEIKAWLNEHPDAAYVILDDDTDMLFDQMNNLVNTDFKDGFADPEMLEMARQILIRQTQRRKIK